MSSFSEDDVRHAAEIREWLVKQISDKQDEVEKLRTALSLVDSLLKQGSFKAAALLASSSVPAQATQQMQASPRSPSFQQQARTTPLRQPPTAENVTRTDNSGDVRPLKRAKDNLLIANAEVGQNSVEIVPVSGVDLNVDTPPFKSFFLNRILEGMKTKDAEKVGKGDLHESESFNYRVEENNGIIKKIIINNYRDKERLNEIFNTSSWAFTRMMEKSGK